MGKAGFDAGAEFDSKRTTEATEKVRHSPQGRAKGVPCQMETNGRVIYVDFSCINCLNYKKFGFKGGRERSGQRAKTTVP